jgi:uncharacterized membrane protein
MDAITIIKLIYRIFTNLPYIITFIALLCAIYHLIKKDEYNFFTSLFAVGFGLLAIISYIICFNFLIPNMSISDPNNTIFNFFKQGVLIILNLIIIPCISLGIIDLEKTYSTRLSYIFIPIVPIGAFFLIENIFSRFLL